MARLAVVAGMAAAFWACRPAHPLAATFEAPTGTLSAKSGLDPLVTNPIAIGTTSAISQIADPTFADARSTVTLQVANSSRFNYFANAQLISNGPSAQTAFHFTQRFTTSAPQWIELTANVNTEPFGNPQATAVATLGRVGQPVSFNVGYTFGQPATFSGAFAAGTFDMIGDAAASTISGQVARRGSVEGTVLIAAIADFNASGGVNSADLATWRAGFGSQSGAFANGNLDDNTSVDGRDFLLWQRQSGTVVPATSAGSPVPEPAGAVLACVAALGWVWRRKAAR
jgi:hypothetical protein